VYDRLLKILTFVFFSVILFFTTQSQLIAGDVFFDTSHRVVFHPQSSEPLGLKRFLSLFEQKGVTVRVGNLDFSRESFKDIETIVLPGSMISFKKSEIDQIDSFVKRGGNLIILLHIASPFARLTQRFGIMVSNMVISEQHNLIEERSQDFFAREIKPHAITQGVKEVALYGTWGLLAVKGAEVVVSTTDHAWGDGNRNRVHDAGEPVGKVGVVAVAQPGEGKVVVIADDAPMANAFLEVGDNLILAQNIVNWMIGKNRTALFQSRNR
jgi:hypothetical protein